MIQSKQHTTNDMNSIHVVDYLVTQGVLSVKKSLNNSTKRSRQSLELAN